MQYEFVSNLPTTSKGLVYMAIDYNASDIPIIDEIQSIAAYSGVKVAKAYERQTIQVQKGKTTGQKMRVRVNPSLP